MARLRDLSRIAAAVVSSLGLIVAPLSSAATSNATAPVFATVMSAQRAHVGRAAATVGTTIFAGDSLDTEELGSLQVRAGAARVLLPAASRIMWGTEDGTVAATLKNGTAIFSTANARSFMLHASNAVIRANGDGPTVGSVSLVNSKELKVSCSRGTLAITVDDDTKTVAEGMAYRVVLDPDSVADDNTSQTNWPGGPKRPKKAGKDRFLLFVIFGFGTATAIALYYALESPNSP